MERKVGLIGLGIMGGAIAVNLAERGWHVFGYDTNQERCETLAASGIRIMPDTGEVARECSVLLTSLPSPYAAKAVAGEITAAAPAQRIVIETSTLTLVDKLEFQSTLVAAGHVALDCPLSGTGAQAAIRDLVVYASGDSAAIAECQPLFADFAKENADLGRYGNGSCMKFVANHLVAIHNVATAEAMLLARNAGLDPDQVLRMVGAGAGGSRIFELRAPMMVTGEYEPATMRISTWKKDMQIIGAFASEMGCSLPLFETSQSVYDDALAMGLQDQDTAAVYLVLENRNSRE